MAPAVRKSRSVNKRFTNEPSPRKDAGSSRKSKQRKTKFSDKLGPQWTKAELERFYDYYRKYGQDWRKVAAAIRNSRSVDMVEALFNMNKAYLSLPEGTASVAGLIAMMTDHYSVMEGSGSEGEGLDVPEAPRKQQKRKRAKPQLSDSREEDDRQQHPVASSDGCLKFLKQARANGTHRRATGKRTPRVPVQTSRDDGEGATPPNKRARKQRDANDDVAAHFLALTLKDASRREGSPQVSESPNKRIEPSDNSPIKSWGKMSRTRKASREKKLESDREDVEGVGEMEAPRKVKRVYKKRVRVEEAECNDSDDNGGACSATEGRRIKSKRRKAGVEASRGTYSPRSPKEEDNKFTSGDEFDALQALADLSASFLPGALMESESSAQLKEERIENDMDEKSSSPDDSHGEKADSEPDDSLLHAISAIGNAAYSRKPKSSRQPSTDCNAVPTEKLEPEPISGSSRRKRKPKKLWDETPAESTRKKSTNKQELAQEDVNMKSSLRTKRSGQGPPQSKQLKAVKELEESTTTTSDKKRSAMDVVEVATTKEVSDSGAASIPQKPPNRRKMSLKKSLQERDNKSSETIHKASRSSRSLSEQELLLKDKLSTSLSHPLARRRCMFEWFYSAIDHPWFAKMEFVDYLNHVGLGHIPRLTRLEWSVIKSSLGRPRRFSERFLQEEREKLKQYRESVRKHYTELRTGAREGLPTDLARPLAVGNRVIAIHPKTREIHDGKILTVDHSQCNVLFDDVGVELVKDIDCMPLNPLEYMPEGLRRQVDKCLSIKKEAQLSGVSVIFPPCGLENIDFSMNQSLNQGDMIAPILHGKVLTNTSSSPHQTNQSHIINYSKGREAEIQRVLALQHALDEKEMEPEMVEIVKGSKTRAQAMVDAAIKAASSVKEGEDAIKMIQEALDMVGKHQPLRSSVVKHEEHANGGVEHHQNPSLSSDASKPMANNDFISQDGSSEKNEVQMPAELITSCVASWLMIQMCTERQYPPAEVAQLIDTAVTSLQPRCPQNLPIYREIQMCMGRIKTQILSLVPPSEKSPLSSLSLSLSLGLTETMQSGGDYTNGFHGELQREEKQVPVLSALGRAKRRSRGGARDPRGGLTNGELRVSDQISEQKPLETQESPPPCTDFDVAYFHSYAHVGIHEEMIKDRSRTETYREAIMQHQSFIQGKVVVDVGCGTGILSIFCAQAGAKRVYAVDASDIAVQANEVVKANGLSDKVIVLHGRVEDVEIDEEVDVIISEWMGYMLLYESMLGSVITARDRWLKPGGLILPSHATLYMAPISHPDRYSHSIDFWRNVYGIDMSAMMQLAKQCAFEEPSVESISGETVLTWPEVVKHIDCQTIKIQELDSVTARYKFKSMMRAPMHGFAFWFDVEFSEPAKNTNATSIANGSSSISPFTEGNQKKRSNPSDALVLSTSPEAPPTHWQQTIVYFYDPIDVEQDQVIEGSVTLSQSKENRRFMNIHLEYSSAGRSFVKESVMR